MPLTPFIIKIDDEGNFVWKKQYHETGGNVQNIITGIAPLSEEEYVLFGRTVPDNGPTQATAFGLAWMIGIDTAGNELWTWDNDTSEYDFYLTDLHKVGNDGWIAARLDLEMGAGDKFKVAGGMVRLDENKEVVWNTTLGVGQVWEANGALVDLEMTIDSNWVAVGNLIVDSFDNIRTAWMVAVTPDGDSLWARTDTLMSPAGATYHDSQLSGLIVLPTGSIVAAGSTRSPSGRYFGLLIKTDPRGCIEPDCHPYMSILDATDNADDFNFDLSPNPTSGLLRVTCPGVTPFSAEVYDGTGRVLAAHSAMRCGDTLDVAHLPSGQYFIRVQSEGSASVVHSVIRL